MNMLEDNGMSLILTRDPKSQNQIKYINVIYYHVRKLVEKKELLVKQVLSAKMLVNGLMKTLLAKPFRKYQDKSSFS